MLNFKQRRRFNRNKMCHKARGRKTFLNLYLLNIKYYVLSMLKKCQCLFPHETPLKQKSLTGCNIVKAKRERVERWQLQRTYKDSLPPHYTSDTGICFAVLCCNDSYCKIHERMQRSACFRWASSIEIDMRLRRSIICQDCLLCEI